MIDYPFVRLTASVKTKEQCEFGCVVSRRNLQENFELFGEHGF